mgnify:FL=1
MVNNSLKNYLNEEYSKEKNYEKIFFKEKDVIKMKKVMLNSVACVLVLIFVGTISSKIYAKIQWDIKFKEFENRELVTETGEIKENWDEGYSENIDMDYVSHDGISAKINSIAITDDKFNAIVDFKFDENITVDSQRFSFGYAVYDENKNIYEVYTRMHIGSNERYDYYVPFLYKEIGVDYNKKNIYDTKIGESTNSGVISAKDRNIIANFNIETTKSFPKSKKIYIRLFDLGYTMIQVKEENGVKKIGTTEDFKLSNTEWLFEIDVPEKFYERTNIELKLKDEIAGVNLEKITVTETNLTAKGTIMDLDKIVMNGMNMESDEWKNVRNELFYISDEDGNIYAVNSFATTDEKDGFSVSVPITKSMLNKKLFLNTKVNGIAYKSEIVEDKID